MTYFRVREIVSGLTQDGGGALPFDIKDLGTPGVNVKPRVKATSPASASVVAPYNQTPPQIDGVADVGQVLSLSGDVWPGATVFNVWWYASGTVVGTSPTYTVQSADRGKTITAAKQALSINGSDPSPVIAAVNSLYIPAGGGDGVLTAEEYLFQEAVADADTRKTYAEIYDIPPGLYEWLIYRGVLPSDWAAALAALGTAAVPVWDGTKYVFLSVGQNALGSNAYFRVALREIANPSNRYWVTPDNLFFVTSNKPAPPIVSYAQGAGRGEIDITIVNAADGRGRSVTGYQYQLDNGTWNTLPGGAALGKRTINTGVPTTTYAISVRGLNANGDGIATTPESATSGVAPVAPAAFGSGDWNVVDKPSLNGDTLTLSYTILPSDGGSPITDVQYQINTGSWVSIGTTPGSWDIIVPALASADIKLRAVNTVDNGATSSKTKTPTQIAAATTTAYFGALTLTNAGSWKPETTAGDEVELTGIVSAAGMTRTWSIVSGGLVANGTPDVDNGKTLTVSTAVGNIVVTISTVANAWSVATGSELSAALSASNAAPSSILCRPRLYDLGRGKGSSTPTGNGRLHSRRYGSNRRTITKHPGQVSMPRSVNTCSRVYSTQYLTIDSWHFYVDDPTMTEEMLISGNDGNGPVRGLYITNCLIDSPDIPLASLTDPTPWGPGGYAGALNHAFALYTSGGGEWDTQVVGCTFKNVYWAGNYTVRGNFKFNNNVVDTAYFDLVRLAGATPSWTGTVPDNGEAKEFMGNTIMNGFGLQEEMSTSAPHVDGTQFIKGTISNFLWWGNLYVPGNYRGSKISTMQMNCNVTRSIFGGTVGLHKGPSMPWGFNPGDDSTGLTPLQTGYLVFANLTLIHVEQSSSNIKISSQGRAFGELLFQNVWCVAGSGSGNSILWDGANFAATDAVRVRKPNTIDANGTSITSNFNWIDNPANASEAMARATPKIGGAAASQGVGALNTSGSFRTTEHPPMHGDKPLLTNSGADVIVTPQASKRAAVTPVRWMIAYRNADGAAWTFIPAIPSPNTLPAYTDYLSGATYTLVAPNKTGLQVMTKWIGTNGLEGTWSEIQTVIV